MADIDRPSHGHRLLGCACVAALLVSGCQSTALNSARHKYYAGDFEGAAELLRESEEPERDGVLFLMERGTIFQSHGDYSESSADFIKAYDHLQETETYSLSEGGASLLINDEVQDFRGAPYERTLLHAFTAQNHLAQARWNDATVEARRIIESLSDEVRGDYPDDAFSRYIAGFCLELIDDTSNAELQYRKAGAQLPHLDIDERTGRITYSTTNGVGEAKTAEAYSNSGYELVCFIMIGRSEDTYADGGQNWSPEFTQNYAELYHQGKYIGRSYALTDTLDLAYTTEEREAARKALKTVTRVAMKESVAIALEHNDQELLADMVRFLLIGLMEKPDVRRWETLPRSLQVARVSCPPDLTEFDVAYKSRSGYEMKRIHVESPITKHRRTYVSFCRDIR